MWVLENSSRYWIEEKKFQKIISLNGQRGKEKNLKEYDVMMQEKSVSGRNKWSAV